MSPLLYQLSYRALRRATLAPPQMRLGGRGDRASDRLPGGMLVVASPAFGQTLALLITFLGIGVLANVLILYIVAQVFAEHKQNQEREPGAR